MCRPIDFNVKYVINPWMQLGSVNPQLALNQWKVLVETFVNLGVDVKTVVQDKLWPDMVFSADQGLIWNDQVLLSNFRFEQRQGEQTPSGWERVAD